MSNQISRIKINKYFIRRVLIVILIIVLGFLGYIVINDSNNSNSYRKIYNIEVNKKTLREIGEDLNIQEVEYKWGGLLRGGNKPQRLVIHHAAADNLSPEEIHKMHLDRGWSGIGYHFYIRSDGTIYRGRDENKVGSHVAGNNTNTLGICLEGNFQESGVSKKQLDALLNLGIYLCLKYDISDILKHNDLLATECPGRFFPFDSIKFAIIEKIKEK
ncbi:MAG: peptidoglycan recognition family protein [Clostridium perfringens]|nr:peptidoglycan recognition family protein [Clostridium perfringens]